MVIVSFKYHPSDRVKTILEFHIMYSNVDIMQNAPRYTSFLKTKADYGSLSDCMMTDFVCKAS